MKILADDIGDIIGKITPPGGIGGGDNPQAGISNFISLGIQIFIIVCVIALLIYMLWGAFDWIISGGEKEKITKAQQKITNAVIGFIVVFAVITVFNLIINNVLHLNVFQLVK